MHIEPSPTEYLGVEFSNLDYELAAATIDQLSKSGSFNYIVTPNVDHIVMLHAAVEDDVIRAFRQAYARARLRLCDSRIVQLLARLQGVTLDVVTGSDLTAYLFDRGYLNSRRVALIGGDEELQRELSTKFPAIDLVQHCPPMGVLRNPQAMAEIVKFVADARCEYVLFAIGAPQSEIAAFHCRAAGNSIGVGLCIGAAIEFIIGKKARAPEWVRAARLEWAHRLFSEPRRLWRRYLVVGPRIMVIAARAARR